MHEKALINEICKKKLLVDDNCATGHWAAAATAKGLTLCLGHQVEQKSRPRFRPAMRRVLMFTLI